MKAQFRKLVTDKRLEECDDVLDALKKVCQADIDSSIRSARDIEKFEKPSWALEQALQIGIQKALTRVIETITK